MAKKSKFGADTVLDKHMRQSALLAHSGSDYFIPKGDFYDGSLSPAFLGLNVDEDTLYVDSNNHRIGIGTNDPASSALITVEGLLRIRESGAIRYRSDLQVSSGTTYFNAYDDTGTAYMPMRIDADALLLNIVSNGFVGVGTTTPEDAASYTFTDGDILHVGGSADGRLIASGSNSGSLHLVDTGGGTNTKWLMFVVAGDAAIMNSVKDDGSGYQASNIFVVNLSTGAVGIGASPSTDEFEVSGDILSDRLGLGITPSYELDMYGAGASIVHRMTCVSSASVWSSPMLMSRRADESGGSPAACIDSDCLWRHDIYEYDGSSFVLSAFVRVFADGAPTDIGDIVPSYYQISVGDDSGGNSSYQFRQEGVRFLQGYLFLHEETTPTPLANYGCIYTKNTNKLFFQDGAGNEHEIAFATT